MTNKKKITEAAKKYEAAYAVHYTTKNMLHVLDLYKGVMVAHPNTPEAEYSRTQIKNIVKGVVPRQRLLDVQIELALSYLKNPETTPVDPAPTPTLVTELPS